MGDKPFDVKLRCYQFSKEIVQFVKEATYERICFSIFDQVLRSGTLIGANIADAKAGS
ncbi:MAG: four helix bundle protein [Mucilaginibacter sp.]